ncbi:UPF0602 protein C4orf47 homolog [Agrilus planipennis]|uniref:Cilia-and flagella-associated protein 96 n=1 Tax=Agrilus planipennis TaxID=224129 RepID=A0A1W4W7Z5_AGRPL|nr:UPF0602 protein C4orf47 homolog [Agrilus planipennis]
MAAWRKSNMKEYAQKHGKPDLERLGLFIEMPYILGKYQTPSLRQRGAKRMLADGPKIKDALGWCYFDKEFKRIFAGEAIVRRKKPKKKEDDKKPIYMPPAAPKKLHGSGEQWGTFAGIMEAVDWRSRVPKKPKKEEKKVKGNMMTNPGKKGGPGYADICFSKWPEHLPEPYPPRPKEMKKGAKPIPIVFHSQPMRTVIYPSPYFDDNPYIDPKGKPGPVYVRPKMREYTIIGDGRWIPVGPSKWQGGFHDGCFESFPPYFIPMKARKSKQKPPVVDDRPPFVPHSYGFKTMFDEGILGKKVTIGVNATNYKVFEPTYIKYLM